MNLCTVFGASLGVLGLAFPLLTAEPKGGQDGWKECRFAAGLETFPNPERGFYAPRMSRRLGRLDGLRQEGITLLLLEMDLRDFKDRDLSREKLDELRQALTAARRAGLKVIFRAAYGFTSRDYRADPKDMDRILGHVRQLGAVLSDQREVLCCVQAGFLGPWGEWHGSNWGDPPSLEARRTLLVALHDAVPAPIPIQIRRPMFIRDVFADEPLGHDLSEMTAYSGSRLSRTGWHNDALLSLPSDMGTYAERGWDRERELSWCKQHGRYTPFGGETVPSSEKTPIDQVVRELELLHASYLNSAYHRGTLEKWRATDYQGENAFRQIERRLGYRLVAERLRYTAPVKAGEVFQFELDLRNVGFAAPFLPREVALVFFRGKDSHRVVLTEADPRRWSPEVGVVQLKGTCRIPAGLAAGPWRLALHLADLSPGLRDDGRYAIRLANRELAFAEDTGWNVLSDDLVIR
jgi:hypothetical protein